LPSVPLSAFLTVRLDSSQMDREKSLQLASEILAEHFPGLTADILADRLASDDNAMLTVAQVAEMLSVSKRTVERLVSSGKLPSILVRGHSRRVAKADVLRMRGRTPWTPKRRIIIDNESPFTLA